MGFRDPDDEDFSCVLLTLTIQRTIEASGDESYDRKRDKMVQALERQGWSVSVESENDENTETEDEDGD